MLSQSLYSKRAFGTLIIASQQNEQEKATPSAGFSLFLQLVVRARRTAGRGCRGASCASPAPLVSPAGRATSGQCQPAAHRLASYSVATCEIRRASTGLPTRRRRRGGLMGSSAGSTPTVRAARQQQRGAGEAESASSPVFLNVYDVTPANGYARWLGLGVYHSGVQVHGVEYAYGAHDGASSGIFEVVPRRCPGYTFRESVLVGTTELSRAEVRALMSDLAAEFPGDAYNLVSRNCNHFCDAACRRLVAGRARIPRWVNRLAKIGVVFTCVIPGNGRAVVRRTPSSASAAGKGSGGVRSRSARQEASPAPPRPRTFFRSLSVGRRKNLTVPRPLSASPPPPLPLADASTSTSSGSTT